MQQIPFNFEYRQAFGKEDFLIGKCNIEAAKMLDSYPVWPAHAIIIYGAKGCGKTHLAHVFIKKTGGKTPIIESNALRTENIPDLLSRSGNVAVENIEDLQDEQALFHLYNYTQDTGGHLFLTCNTSPSNLDIKLPDLSSRLLAVPSIRIDNPDDALISALLVKLFSDVQIDISKEAVAYAVKNMDRSFQSARELVAAADKLSLSKQQAITIPLLREIFTSAKQKDTESVRLL